jgi:hypothetical protein
MSTDSSKVTWEFVQSTVPNVEREWGVADEIVREFNELDEAQMELKLQQGIDSDFIEELEDVIERSESDVRIVFDEAYGRAWFIQGYGLRY